MNELLLLALLVSEDPYEKVQWQPPPPRPYYGHPYQSPYRTFYPPPGYRERYWGIPQQGYWGPRWRQDPYWNYNRWRQGW